MADPYSILGLTGPAEQLGRLVVDLIHRHKAYQDNKQLAGHMLSAYRTLHDDVTALRREQLDRLSPRHRQLVENEIDRIHSFISKSLTDLTEKVQHPKGKLSGHAFAISVQENLETHKQNAERLHDSIMQTSRELELHTVVTDGHRNADVFTPRIWAEPNASSIYVDLNSCDTNGVPDACEARLKAAVLQSEGNAQVGATAVGQGGVGKTCALRAIAGDPDVQVRFPGGIYFLTLGKDATVGRLLEQLCKIVSVSGGRHVMAELRKESDLEMVLARVQE